MKNFTRLTLTLALLFGVLGGANSVKANRYIVYNNGTAGTNNYSKQAICKLNNPLVLGTQYIIKAKIKAENADGSTGLALWIQDEADYPNTKTSYQASIVPTKEFVEYTWYFTPSEFQGTRLVFCTGLLGGRIYIDDVTCKPNGESTEFVDNGNFNSADISNWTNNWQGPSYTLDSDTENADFVIVYNNGEAGSSDYSKQAICKLNNPLELETQYIIKAKIKVENADREKKIGFWIQDDDSHTSYEAAITPTTEFVEYTWYYTPTFQATKLTFCTGTFGGKVYLDDVTCKPNGGSTEFVDNGNFNSADISNWTNNWQGPSYTRFDYEVPVPVGDAGFATFSAAKAVNVDGVVTAYAAKYEGGKVVLTSVTQIPAGAGVVIEAAEGTYTVPAINSVDALGSDNELLVSDGNVVTADDKYYALYNGTHGVGFYLIDNDVTIPAGKAYLQIAAAGRSFLGFSDEATAISNVKAETADDAIYNVAGQRVTKTQKGLYIVNGKKMLVK